MNTLTQTQHISEPFYLKVAQGEVAGHSFIRKSGSNPRIDTTTSPETVWTTGGLYPWHVWNALGIGNDVYIKSDNSNDTQLVVVRGLDAAGLSTEESVRLQGQTPVKLSGKFYRIQESFIDEDPAAAGIVTLHVDTGNGTTVGLIEPGYGQTLMAVYTVPLDHTAYAVGGSSTVQRGESARLGTFTRYYGKSFRLRNLTENYENINILDVNIPIPLPPLTDVEVRVIDVDSNRSRVTASLELLIVKDGNWVQW